MLTNKLTGKFYIGSTVNLRNRMKYYKYSFDRNPNKELANDIIKLGFDAFTVTILEECSHDTLRQRERFYIDSLHAAENGYNLTVTTTCSERIKEFNNRAWQNDEYRRDRSRASSELQRRRLIDPVYRAEKTRQLKQATDKMKKPVGMYTKDGEFVRSFDGVREAERWLISNGYTTSHNASSILSDACDPNGRHKTAYKHIWKYL